jgi:hypothetical protein
MSSPTPRCLRDSRAYRAIQQLSSPYTLQPSPKLPLTSPDRLATTSEDKSILYLAYGSNLSAETFRGTRGIHPLSAINVHVPSLTLTFDLAGIPYLEPCFANTRYSTPPPPGKDAAHAAEYRKNRWKKGLVGVLYEVTLADYRTIISTEGGGASYQDIVVPCFPLDMGLATTPDDPQGTPVRAHTLMSPPSGSRIVRPDPAYAQPSWRYLKLITDGAQEHCLPADYAEYLSVIRGYTITTWRQRVGCALFLGSWLPWLMVAMTIGRLVGDEAGRVPAWYAKLIGLFFTQMWKVYDFGFKHIWGDGERTMGDAADEEAGWLKEEWQSEKSALLS